MSDFSTQLLQRKLAHVDVILDAAHATVAQRNLATGRMHQGHALFGDAYLHEDLPANEAEEDADKLCYRALRLLSGEPLTWRQQFGLRLWGIATRMMDGRTP